MMDGCEERLEIREAVAAHLEAAVTSAREQAETATKRLSKVEAVQLSTIEARATTARAQHESLQLELNMLRSEVEISEPPALRGHRLLVGKTTRDQLRRCSTAWEDASFGELDLLGEASDVEGPVCYLLSLEVQIERLEGLRGNIEHLVESSTRGLASETAAHILAWMWSRFPDPPLDPVVVGVPLDQLKATCASFRHLEPRVVALYAVQRGLHPPGGGDALAVEVDAPSGSNEAPGVEDGEAGGSPALGH